MIELSPRAEPAFEFVPGDSVLHRLGPAGKLCLIAAATLLALLCSSTAALGSTLGALSGALLCSGVPVRGILRDLRIVAYQLCLTAVLAFASQGLTSGAAGLVLSTTLRFAVMTAAASLVMRTTPPWTLFRALRLALGERLGFLALLSMRYVPVLSAELAEIHALQAARLGGLEPGREAGAWRKAESLCVPFVQRCVRLAEELAVAAHARGIAPPGGEE